MSKGRKIVFTVLTVIILIPVVLSVALQLPFTQTRIVNLITSSVSKNIDADLSVGRVYYSMPNRLILSNVNLTQGKERDTLLSLRKLLVHISVPSLVNGHIHARRISLEDGQFNIVHVNDSTTNLSLLLQSFSGGGDKEGGNIPRITVDRLTIKRFDFAMLNRFRQADSTRAVNPRKIDWHNLELYGINFDARKIRYKENLELSIGNLSFRERSGLEVDKFKCQVKVTMGPGINGIYLDNLAYADNWSSLSASNFSMRFKQFSDFSDFCNQVVMAAEFDNTLLDFRTLEHYGGLRDNELKLVISGPVNGAVANLRSPGLTVSSSTGRTLLDLSFNITGLPEVETTLASLHFREMSTYSDDLAEIISQVAPGVNKSSISRIAPGDKIRFRGSIDGMFDDMVAYGSLTSANLGDAEIDLLCKSTHDRGYSISGHLNTDDLDLARMFQSRQLGKVTCEGDVSVMLGSDKSVSVDSLTVSRLGLFGYDYSAIAVDGVLTENDFNGSVVSRDPNLDFAFNGGVTFRQKDTDRKRVYDKYKFKLDLNKANLDELNLDTRDSQISLKMDADMDVTESNIMGKVVISSIKARLAGEKMDIGDIDLKAYLSEGRHLMRLTSSMAEARYRGTAPITDFITALSNGTVKRHLPNLVGEAGSAGLGNEYSFTVTTGDLKPVARFLIPDLDIAKGSTVRIDMNSGNALTGDIKSSLLSFGKFKFKALDADIEGDRDSMSVRLLADDINVGSLSLTNDSLSVGMKNNRAGVHLGFFNDYESDNDSRASINSEIHFPNGAEDEKTIALIDILPSSVDLKGNTWILPPSTVRYGRDNVEISKFRIERGLQMLSADGMISESLSDTLNVRMQDFDLSMVDLFLSKPAQIKGSLTGIGRLFGISGEAPGLLLGLKAKDISVLDDFFGDFDIRSRWNEAENRIDLNATNTDGNRRPLSIRGNYSPETKSVKAQAEFDKFKLGFIEPVISSIATDISGALSGSVDMEGPLDRLNISCRNTRFNDLRFKLDFTQVPYTLNGPFSVNEKGVTFDNVDIADEYGKHGTVNGGVTYDMFKNVRLNTRINLKEMLGLNTTSRDNSSFFGKAFATGSVRLSGPLDRIRIDLNITTEQNSNIHIPLGSSGKSRASLLTFVGEDVNMNEFDSLRVINRMVRKTASSSQLMVNVNINATPDAEVVLDINPASGDVLKARGNGRIGITVGGADDFSIKGDYSIREGDFLFNLMGITSKTFLLDEGGTISFNGDIMQSDLDLTATYRTKASVGTLLADSTSLGTRRTVDCGIGITGKLSNPQINFGITIPDLDPSTQSRVENMLNTEDKRMRQVLALLVSGSFVPESESGIVNNTTILYSNASEIMANQLNNIFRQLDIPVDLGFSYQPTSTGRDIFDVAISTQLFNNRVTINGNLGNRRYVTGAKADFVGDVDVEVKLTKSGKIRMSAFSHSTDEYSNFLDQAQRNGIGINYQEEFDSFRELLRKIFWSKEKRERVEQEERQQRIEEMRKQQQNE